MSDTIIERRKHRDTLPGEAFVEKEAVSLLKWILIVSIGGMFTAAGAFGWEILKKDVSVAVRGPASESYVDRAIDEKLKPVNAAIQAQNDKLNYLIGGMDQLIHATPSPTK